MLLEFSEFMFIFFYPDFTSWNKITVIEKKYVGPFLFILYSFLLFDQIEIYKYAGKLMQIHVGERFERSCISSVKVT